MGGAVWVHRLQQQRAWDLVRQLALRYALPLLDALHHRDFEYAIRDLMRRDGCTDARQIGGAGDNGRLTIRCTPLATQLHIHLADRRTLANWARGGQPLWELLPKIPAPRRSR
ncbi:hypothetical protein [Streptomyces clavifer]|uniref:hypothetical protein n=1 Tax=Streptomyces clavifer TaxID=68188 RepID=UPI0033E66C3F